MWIYLQTVLWARWEGTFDRAQFLKRASTKKTVWCWHFPRSCRGMELQERLICGGRWTLWQVLSSTRTDFRIVSTFVLFPRHYTNWHKVAVAVCVWAVKAVLRRLMFQFKYMQTREVIIHRLGAEHHEESSTVMQGTVIWFLINTVVRFCQVSVLF